MLALNSGTVKYIQIQTACILNIKPYLYISIQVPHKLLAEILYVILLLFQTKRYSILKFGCHQKVDKILGVQPFFFRFGSLAVIPLHEPAVQTYPSPIVFMGQTLTFIVHLHLDGRTLITSAVKPLQMISC